MKRLAAFVLLLAATAALAQPYPARPVKLIVPFPPGGNTDIVGRLIAQKLSDAFGQQVYVENRGGAGGTIGAEAAAKSPNDGYTLFFSTTGTLASAPSMQPNLRYDPNGIKIELNYAAQEAEGISPELMASDLIAQR